jgi:hypothetical protein
MRNGKRNWHYLYHKNLPARDDSARYFVLNRRQATDDLLLDPAFGGTSGKSTSYISVTNWVPCEVKIHFV